MFQRFGNMKFAYRNREFWCKGYYVDTVGKNTTAIKEYIANQLERDKEMDQKNFTAIQRQVKQQFGSLKETKFFSFERYDQADKVTYIAGFSKEKIVVMSFVFGKDAKLQNFSFSPYKAPEQAPAEKK